MDWFLYDRDLRYERVKNIRNTHTILASQIGEILHVNNNYFILSQM